MLVFWDERMCLCMSAVVGICGESFGLLFGDTRKIRFKDGNFEKPEVVNDTTQKIFQINGRVMVGATGLFAGNEKELLAPFDGFSDKDVISMRLAAKAIKSYLERIASTVPGPRGYIVVGKDNRGRFCSYEIRINTETGMVELTENTLDPNRNNYAISCALPRSLARYKDTYLNKISECILSSTRVEEMAQKVCRVIQEMSDKDMSIGKEIDVILMT